ncbi:MAG: sialidase family protein, partial [Promethearchaeota archaeon]
IQHQDIYSRGGDDYYTFRIPSMVVIPQGTTLNNSNLVVDDIILTFAEARQNSVLDSGAIDTVLRRSIDAGVNWEDMLVLNRWPIPAEEIKFGNPTAVFDNITGQVFLTYTNMSQLNGLRTLFYRVSSDGGATWTSPVRLNGTDRSVLGPGHGIQLTVGSYAGRLIIPAYDRNGSYVIFSDNDGETWEYGENVGYGNEHEVLELDNGTLYMSLRTRVGVSSVHEPFDRLYALSSDGGQTWTEEKMHSYLPEPIVMGSTARLSSSATSDQSRILTSLPGSYTSRVKMTIYMSYDEAQTWTEEKIIYFGPSGYSELAVLSDGTICCFFERGRVEYSDILTFAQVDLAWLLSD